MDARVRGERGLVLRCVANLSEPASSDGQWFASHRALAPALTVRPGRLRLGRETSASGPQSVPRPPPMASRGTSAGPARENGASEIARRLGPMDPGTSAPSGIGTRLISWPGRQRALRNGHVVARCSTAAAERSRRHVSQAAAAPGRAGEAGFIKPSEPSKRRE